MAKKKKEPQRRRATPSEPEIVRTREAGTYPEGRRVEPIRAKSNDSPAAAGEELSTDA